MLTYRRCGARSELLLQKGTFSASNLALQEPIDIAFRLNNATKSTTTSTAARLRSVRARRRACESPTEPPAEKRGGSNLRALSRPKHELCVGLLVSSPLSLSFSPRMLIPVCHVGGCADTSCFSSPPTRASARLLSITPEGVAFPSRCSGGFYHGLSAMEKREGASFRGSQSGFASVR
ncbi:hypothetical protein AOLI_G00313300 [Acnodon oligacanthus]